MMSKTNHYKINIKSMACSLAKHLLEITFLRTLLRRLKFSVPGPASTNTTHSKRFAVERAVDFILVFGS